MDWFEVQAPATGIIEVAVTSVPNNLDLNVGIYQVIDNVLTLIADDRVSMQLQEIMFSLRRWSPRELS